MTADLKLITSLVIELQYSPFFWFGQIYHCFQYHSRFETVPHFCVYWHFYRMILVVLQTSTSTSALLFFAMAALFFMFKGRDNYLMISDCKYINQSSMINYQYGHPFYNHIGNLRVMNDINHYTNMRTDCVYTLFKISRGSEIHTKFWDCHTDLTDTGIKCTQEWQENLAICI